MLNFKGIGIFLVFVVLIIVFYLISPAFLHIRNISVVLKIAPEMGIVALGITLLMTSGEFDLSVGSIFALCPYIMARLYVAGLNPWIAVMIALVIGIGLGYLNGLLVTKLQIPSFIVTLGTMLVWRGAVLLLSSGIQLQILGFPTEIFAGQVIGIPCQLIWFLIIATISFIILENTKFGNWIFATGGNKQAAISMGINTDRVKIINYMIVGFLATFAGILQVARTNVAWPAQGQGLEMEAIAASVIGRTSLYGGAGTIVGTLIGSLLIRLIDNGLLVMRAPACWFQSFIGLIIILCVTLNRYIERGVSSERITSRTGKYINIHKSFGKVNALQGVNFSVGYNEIVGLIGDNGAGKSTLIKILSGVLPPDKGEIFFEGKSVSFRSHMDAMALGIETIYQDAALVDQMSIMRNIFLSREPVKSIVL